MMQRWLLLAVAGASLIALPGFAQDVSVCLITKTDTNPFFVKMKEGARAKAAELGVELTALAGREEGDNEGQVAAIESCIARGVDGILLVPTDSSAIVEAVKTARANGIVVIALDTPLDPTDAADATFATDNFKASWGVGSRSAWRRRGHGEDRLSQPFAKPADRRRATQPRFHAGLRHCARRSEQNR
jgi:fructose transport system substrate-binding protein